MRSKRGTGITTALVLSMLLGLAWPTRGAAQRPVACCVCNRCDGRIACFNDLTGSDCEAACSHTNSTSCGFDVVDSRCAAIPACDTAARTRAPAMGAGGLTVAALFLAGLGVLGVRRAARRARQ